MQHGLVKEQQVPIMLNLVNQLDKDVIIIPNKIQLDLALIDTNEKHILNDLEESKYRMLRTLLEFDKSFIHSNQSKQTNRFELCNQLQFLEAADEEYSKLVIVTSIQVYGDEWLHADSCSLTVPRLLVDLERIEDVKKEISIEYVIKEFPDFEYVLN